MEAIYRVEILGSFLISEFEDFQEERNVYDASQEIRRI